MRIRCAIGVHRWSRWGLPCEATITREYYNRMTGITRTVVRDGLVQERHCECCGLSKMKAL